MKLFRVGGLYHWRIGRLGGCFYWKRKPCGELETESLRYSELETKTAGATP